MCCIPSVATIFLFDQYPTPVSFLLSQLGHLHPALWSNVLGDWVASCKNTPLMVSQLLFIFHCAEQVSVITNDGRNIVVCLLLLFSSLSISMSNRRNAYNQASTRLRYVSIMIGSPVTMTLDVGSLAAKGTIRTNFKVYTYWAM